MVEEDIHKIWTIWGAGGLLEKLGPERTIRELKKRCDAGAIIGCTLYKLLIDKWLNVALTAGTIDPITKEKSDPHEAGPAIQFMLAAGEDEFVKKVEQLREKYGDTIPRSVQLDLRDEFNLDLEKRVGRRIPLSPTDATKKDIEDSKRISTQLGAGEITPVAKPVAPVEKEKEKPPPKPEVVPAIPLTPVKVTPPTLELMEEEIKKRAELLKKKKATGELEAGEQPGVYSNERKKGREAARLCFEHILKTGKGCSAIGYYVSFVETIARIIRDKKTIPQSRIRDLSRLREIEPSEFNFGVYDFLVEKVQEHQKVSGELKTEIEKAKTKEPKFETARRIISTLTAPGTESEEKIEISPSFVKCPGRTGFGMCKGCLFKYTVTSTSACPYQEEFRGTIGEGNIKKIVGMIARETGEPEPILSKSFQEYIKRIEMVKNMDSLPELKEYFENVDSITVMTEYDKLQLKQFIIQRMQDIINYYEKSKPSLPERYRETPEPEITDEKEEVPTEPSDYTQWTFADFEQLIAGLEDIEDLEELYERVDASDKLSQDEAITVRNLIKMRIDELVAGYAELAKIGG